MYAGRAKFPSTLASPCECGTATNQPVGSWGSSSRNGDHLLGEGLLSQGFCETGWENKSIILKPVPDAYLPRKAMAIHISISYVPHLPSKVWPPQQHLSLHKFSVMRVIRIGTHSGSIHFISYLLLYSKIYRLKTPHIYYLTVSMGVKKSRRGLALSQDLL